MAQQLINVGTSANDGTGDTLRASQQKTNANTTELYLTKLEGIVAGDNVTIDNSNPLIPVISSTGGGGSSASTAKASRFELNANIDLGISPTGSVTVIDFDNQVFNTNSSVFVNNGSGTVTCTQSGSYLVTTCIVLESPLVSAITKSELGIRKNGTAVICATTDDTPIAVGNNIRSLTTSTIINLSANDTLQTVVNLFGTTANGRGLRLPSLLGTTATQVSNISIEKLEVGGIESLGFTPVPETRTLTINGTTQDLSANRTFTVSGGDVYEYMNFYISGNVPYNANPDLEPFPTRGNRDVGNLAYPGDFWNRVTSTTGDYRGTAQSIFKASNLVEVIANSSAVSSDLQIRVVAFDVSAGGTIANPRSIAVKTILNNSSGVRLNVFSPSDINLTNVINANTFISITATVKSGTAAISMERCYITLKFKNI